MEEGGNIAKSPTYHTESSDVWVHLQRKEKIRGQAYKDLYAF